MADFVKGENQSDDGPRVCSEDMIGKKRRETEDFSILNDSILPCEPSLSMFKKSCHICYESSTYDKNIVVMSQIKRRIHFSIYIL